MFVNKLNTITLHPANKHLSNFFWRNQIHYNYKLDENVLKTLIPIKILLTDPKKK